MLPELKKVVPLKVSLREGYHPQVVTWLQAQEIDLSIGLLGGPRPASKAASMFELSLALLRPRRAS